MVAASDTVARVRYGSILTTAAKATIAANSALCRATLGGGEIKAARFSAIRLLSGALAAHVLLSGRDPQIGNGSHGLTIKYGFGYFI